MLNRLVRLIAVTIEIKTRMRWLKTIHKEVEKRDKLRDKFIIQSNVVSALVREYKNKYPNDLDGGTYENSSK